MHPVETNLKHENGTELVFFRKRHRNPTQIILRVNFLNPDGRFDSRGSIDLNHNTLSSREKRNDGTMRKRTSNILPIIIDAMNESISQNQSHRESKCN